ncbi:Ribose import permease protein RbsC [bioreactor metagenome]|uniref:Ribose import permease protein RbsC n=1 Tax=bioreactor metagenome TaxID=1076179 RepID=A0A645BDN2_9ZZZZ
MQTSIAVFSRRALRTLTKQKAVIAILALLILMLFFKTNFYTSYNLLSVLKDAAVNEIIAFGVTLTVIAAGCDLSVGAVMCLSGIVAIQLMNKGVGMPLSISIAVLSGAVVGFINGFLVVQQKTEAFIITLGTGMLIKGINQQLTDAHPVSCTNMEFMKIANGKVGGVIPNLALYMIVIGLLVYALLRYTSYGRNLYALGGDYDVAKYSGINVVTTKWVAFVLSGALAAVAGVLLSSKLNTGSSIYGDDTALMVNCGVVVGGTSFAGGVGGVWQSFIGLMVLQLLTNCMNMLGIAPYLQQVCQGVVIVAIIWLDCFGRKRKREDV